MKPQPLEIPFRFLSSRVSPKTAVFLIFLFPSPAGGGGGERRNLVTGGCLNIIYKKYLISVSCYDIIKCVA
jgi:hypothetical protein